MLRPLLAALLLTTLPLAGCLDDETTAPGEEAAPAANKETGPDGAPVEAADASARGGPGSIAHKHDYWAGRTEVTLFDDDVPLFFCLGAAVDRFRPPCGRIEMGNGSVVYQGTDKLTFTATWSDPAVVSLNLRYRDAQMPHETPIALTSGTPVELPVNTTAADMAHTSTSKWAFDLGTGSDANPGAAFNAKIHAKILIHRGLDLPLDPPHPDFWTNGPDLDLGTVNGTMKGSEQYTLLDETTAHEIRPPPGHIVPPGATRLIVHYTWKVKDPIPQVAYRFDPYYKSAEHPSWERVKDDTGNAGTQVEGTFELELEPPMTDSPYATESQWVFTFRQYQELAGLMVIPNLHYLTGVDTLQKDMDYSIHVIAVGPAA